MTAHGAVASLILGQLAAGHNLCTFPAAASRAFQTLLDFSQKLTLVPETVTAADYESLQQAGLDQTAVIQGILIVVGFNFINRIADAMHFETPSVCERTPSVHFLRWFGYRHLSGTRLPFRRTPWMRVPVRSRSKRAGNSIVALVKCTDRWLRFLIRLGSQAGAIAPDITSRLWRKVMRDPATITPDDVTAVISDGCTQSAVFNLILGAASASALLRLSAGMRVIPVQTGISSCAPQNICKV